MIRTRYDGITIPLIEGLTLAESAQAITQLTTLQAFKKTPDGSMYWYCDELEAVFNFTITTGANAIDDDDWGRFINNLNLIVDGIGEVYSLQAYELKGLNIERYGKRVTTNSVGVAASQSGALDRYRARIRFGGMV